MWVSTPVRLSNKSLVMSLVAGSNYARLAVKEFYGSVGVRYLVVTLRADEIRRPQRLQLCQTIEVLRV